MDTLGRHLLAEYYGCNQETLNDETKLNGLLLGAAEAAGVRVIDSIRHSFSPVGVTCVVAIEESHLSLHTWPEAGYAAADFFTCGDGMPDKAHRFIAEGLEADRTEILTLRRGLREAESSIQVEEHIFQKAETLR